MKKLLTIIAFLFLYVGAALAVPMPNNYNTDQVTVNFEAQICEPIGILDPGTIQLGDIPPGVTKNLNAESYRMQFTITGCQNWAIQVGGTCNATGDQGDCTLNYWWQYWQGGWQNAIADADLVGQNLMLDASGKAYVSVYPTSITTQASAAAGNRSFQVMVTATYQSM